MPYVTVDVFTDRPFAGNPLAVVTDARGLTTEQMQAIATEFNYAESTFVLPPDDPAHTARVRIFTRTSEVPFAGHPNVGTAFVLAHLAEHKGRTLGASVVFEELAGLVPVELLRNSAGLVQGATLTAPQPLSLGDKVPAALAAACVGLEPSAIVTARHEPIHASVGLSFAIAEVTGEALSRAKPNLDAFTEAARRSPTRPGIFSLHLYARAGGAPDLRARMFSPLGGNVEDPATGSANGALGGLLASLADEADTTLRLEILQGAEMGRPSMLSVTAEKQGSVVTRIRVGGRCVPAMEGEIRL